MAIFYPPFEQIYKLKVPPTKGETTLLRFLNKVLDDTYEVYFNPYLNGDRPDLIIMREGNGVMIIEVKDWDLNNFRLNEKKKWVYIPNDAVVKSPIDQVLKYKDNLFELHVDNLLEKKIRDIRHFNIVKCAIYFHCASQNVLENLLVKPYKDEVKYQTWLKYNIELIGRDMLEEQNFKDIIERSYLSPSQHSYLFTRDIYRNIKRLLAPTIHQKSQVDNPYNYNPKQKEIIYSKTLEQRIKGVFGSGKTTVLAARAVQAYKRTCERTVNPRILILTYNITLKNFIHDKLMMVDETFPIESFIIINYHSFINAELNNLNIEFDVPENYPNEKIGEYLDHNYYSNILLFDKHKDLIKKYDAVLIDEIQDYHRAWMDIIKNFFRDPMGDYVLFGDVKQNIYRQPTIQKDVITNVRGVNELKRCYRSDFKVQDLASSFQHHIFKDKYDADDFTENKTIGSLGLTIDKEGFINYMYLSNTDSIAALYNIIRGNILKSDKIAPNDITILGYTTDQLRFFDCYYRYRSCERTTTMMETIETMYMTHLNFYGKNTGEPPCWFNNITSHFQKKLFPKRTKLYDDDFIKLRQHIAKIFTIYDLYTHYPENFLNRLSEECNICGISTQAFFAFQEFYKDDLDVFKKAVYRYDYKTIRDNKKLHFWMNTGTIKISTIHSFKGWESEVVFLIIEPQYNNGMSFNMAFDELLYTGLTRCRRNLIVINFGNTEYDVKIRPLIENLK